MYDGVIPTDAFVPCDTFSRVQLSSGESPYQVTLCSNATHINSPFCSINIPDSLDLLNKVDTIILPGTNDTAAPIPASLIQALQQAAEAGTRIASICTGAFVLAATGLLNGKKATTHWNQAMQLQQAYPKINVDPNVLFVDNGQILTSAGALAGIDLCLHMIRNDFGAQVAADAARISVMPLERAGGQKQFIKHPQSTDNGSSLQPLLSWVENNLSDELNISQLAKQAAMSPRTLNRRFVEQLGIPPSAWILNCRARYAQQLLETTSYTMEQVATKTGFGSTANLRKQFRRVVGTSPSAYRKSFGSRAG
ncbi:AraC family transcriptional regulator [Photobacterium alginatilyticum]|uniref:Helix-turn-helix domain-containing protein n=2 Tax=Photobacterium alginatilyticum TaxID=1775171 RepID=A0ABW9YHN2_9GAMM|nr:helix-turn-helix domain-containing protein [Photobacterium alginatilyticum]